MEKMSKKDLLEILVLQSKKIDDLENKLKTLTEELNDKKINIKNSGTLAEACLKLNKIFEDADKAAKLYLDNIKEGKNADNSWIRKIFRERRI